VHLGRTRGPGVYVLDTAAGEVTVAASAIAGTDRMTATLTSVEPRTTPAEAALTSGVLGCLGWADDALDAQWRPAVGFAGANHLLLAVGSRARLADVAYDFDALEALMTAHDLTTVSLLWFAPDGIVHSRNLFPVGGVVEDPATGAAAAALGGHLRLDGRVEPPATVEIHQGDDMGRPSRLTVHVPLTGGIDVSGEAVEIPVDLQ